MCFRQPEPETSEDDTESETSDASSDTDNVSSEDSTSQDSSDIEEDLQKRKRKVKPACNNIWMLLSWEAPYILTCTQKVKSIPEAKFRLNSRKTSSQEAKA